MTPGKVEIILDPATGGASFLHSDEAMRLAAKLAGTPTIRRASHVEPIAGTTCWEADLSPVGGPRLGPFDTHQQALDSEAAWLREHRLYCKECINDGDNQRQGQQGQEPEGPPDPDGAGPV